MSRAAAHSAAARRPRAPSRRRAGAEESHRPRCRVHSDCERLRCSTSLRVVACPAVRVLEQGGFSMKAVLMAALAIGLVAGASGAADTKAAHPAAKMAPKM